MFSFGQAPIFHSLWLINSFFPILKSLNSVACIDATYMYTIWISFCYFFKYQGLTFSKPHNPKFKGPFRRLTAPIYHCTNLTE